MPKIVDHTEYKEKLLIQCFEIFARRGFEKITLREIATELGISNGSLYYYFPAKKDMLEEMFNIYTKRDVEEMLKMFKDSDPFEHKVSIIFDYVAGRESYFQNILLLTIDYFRNNFSEQNSKQLNQFMVNYRDGIGAIIGLPETISSMVILFLNGLVYNRMIFQDMVSFENQANTFKKMIKLFLKEKNL